jgi:hypothetical protein
MSALTDLRMMEHQGGIEAEKIDWLRVPNYIWVAGGVAEMRQGLTPRPAAPIASCLEISQRRGLRSRHLIWL